jgi:CheY-like chemotaxis protein
MGILDRSLREPGGSASIAAGQTRPARESAAMTGANSPRRRILLVEDETLISMLLEDMLLDLGHEIAAVVPRLNEALAAVQRENFDLAILDVHLHGQNAYPVAEALIERRIPFVFATGYGERGLPEKFQDQPILQKPFARDDLERVLKALLV